MLPRGIVKYDIVFSVLSSLTPDVAGAEYPKSPFVEILPVRGNNRHSGRVLPRLLGGPSRRPSRAMTEAIESITAQFSACSRVA